MAGEMGYSLTSVLQTTKRPMSTRMMQATSKGPVDRDNGSLLMVRSHGRSMHTWHTQETSDLTWQWSAPES